MTAWPRAHRPLALMLPVPQVPGHCKHLSSSQHRLEFPNRRQTPEGLRSNTSGPGQGSHGSVWGSHGGYLDIPGSDLLQGSASSQSASDGAALELSVQSQTPKCPASHWGQTVPGDQSPPPPCLHTPGPTFSPLPPAPSHQETDWELQSGRAHSEHIWAQRLQSFPVCLHCNKRGVRPRVSEKNTWTAAPPAPPRPAQLHGEG